MTDIRHGVNSKARDSVGDKPWVDEVEDGVQ